MPNKGLPPSFYKDYEHKTTGVRRLRHAIATVTRSRNKMEAVGKSYHGKVNIDYDSAKEAVAEWDAIEHHNTILEDAGNRLLNHLNLLPPHMITSEMRYDLERWKNTVAKVHKEAYKLPSINKK